MPDSNFPFSKWRKAHVSDFVLLEYFLYFFDNDSDPSHPEHVATIPFLCVKIKSPVDVIGSPARRRRRFRDDSDLPPTFVPLVMLVLQARGQGRQARGPQAPAAGSPESCAV